MNPDRLLQYFERIAEAPDAVARLRRFVLDLAVRGKLVEQDPADESAAKLVEHIEVQRARLVSQGIIRRQEVLEPIGEDELPFDLRRGWSAARMGFLALKLGAGSTPLGGKSVYENEGIPFLRSQNVHDYGLKVDDVARIPKSVHERMAGTHLQENDVLLNITGASIGRCALLPCGFGEGNVSQHVSIIRLVQPAIREFIHLSLISPVYQKLIMDVQVGVSREGLSSTLSHLASAHKRTAVTHES
jgi:type I restriction enzyme, S subunit